MSNLDSILQIQIENKAYYLKNKDTVDENQTDYNFELFHAVHTAQKNV